MSDRKGRLIIICGLPGSGKTTLATKLVGELCATLFASDDWMDALHLDMWSGEARAHVEALQWKMAQEILKLGGTAIIEWGSWGRDERDVLRLGAQKLGAAVELIYVTAPLEALHERITLRGRENPPITLEMLKFWSEQFDTPDAEELALYDPPATRTSL